MAIGTSEADHRGGGDVVSTGRRSANSSNRAGAVLASIVISVAFLGVESPGVGSAAEPICRAPRLVGLTLELAVGQMAVAHCNGVNPREPDGGPAEATTSIQRIIERQSPKPGAPATAVTVWLRALCWQSAEPGPPAGEPFIRRGPTTLVSGLFLDGGPLRRRSSCRSGTPSPGTIEVLDPSDTRLVARQRVRAGRLAHIRLAPGTYFVRGTFANATSNGAPIQTLPVRVRIPSHRIVRRDVVASIK
jgi:hypothetical protein